MEFRFSFFNFFMLTAIAGRLTYHFKFRETPETKEGDPRSAHKRSAQAEASPEPAVASYLGAGDVAKENPKATLVRNLVASVSSVIKKEEPETIPPNPLLTLAADAPELHELLEKNFSEIFFRKGARAFTRRKNGESANTVQLHGLELEPPIPATLSEDEKERGIRERIHFPVRVTGWREYSEGFWGEWQPSKPPMLSGFTFEKREDAWALISSPVQWYSLE
ncbi:MAG: hypothetical protein P1U87_07665 [Verrucomicrobiales bacterium]|nr:hypothetical protein [Verrucomicrobiales bacterium]